MHIQRQLREDGTCVLTLDREDGEENFLDPEALEELDAHLAAIAEPGLEAKALVITSAKRTSFGVSTPASLLRGFGAEERTAFIQLGQRAVGRLAALKIPTVAAIHGPCLGGALELALACDWRVATAEHTTQFSLPETRLGLLPAWGGSTRLPRLIGLIRALEFVTQPRLIEAQPALELGLVDALASREHLFPVALEWVAKGKRPAKLAHTWLSEMVSSPLALSKARTSLAERSRGHYPAQTRALEVMAGGLRVKTAEEALELERQAVLEVAAAPSAGHLLDLALRRESAQALEWPGTGRAPEIRQAAIIGAGHMGTPLAHALSRHGVRVLLRDVDAAHLATSMQRLAELFAADEKAHLLSPLEVRDAMDRVAPAHTEVSLRRADLILETSPEKLDTKKTIFRKLDELTRSNAILATNTAALPITELASATRLPGRVVGLHFFPPIAERELVEVIVTPKTTPEVVQGALQFVQRLGKLPVLVKDSPGFLVNRILQPYLIEAGELFWAGSTAKEIDEAMLDFGMPMGPLRQTDETGIETTEGVAATLSTAFPQWMRLPRVLPKLREAGLLGRASGKGFYTYSGDKEPRPNRAAEQLRPSQKAATTAEEIQRRLVLLMVNEAARCLDEGIAEGAADIDFALVLAGGFPAFRGGPLHYADAIGLPALLEQLTQLAETAGSHYTPSALISRLAQEGRSFFEGAGGSV